MTDLNGAYICEMATNTGDDEMSENESCKEEQKECLDDLPAILFFTTLTFTRIPALSGKISLRLVSIRTDE